MCLLFLLLLPLVRGFHELDIEPRNSRIQHMRLYNNRLYVGATNHLYSVNASNLAVLETVTTGPVLDNPYCSPTGDCLHENARLNINTTKLSTPNINKVLLIYETENVLLTCGTVHQGTCQIRQLHNMQHIVDPKSLEFVAANLGNASTVAFVGRGPDSTDVLYVAATFTSKHYREHVPAVATRSLRADNAFELLENHPFLGQSGLILKSEHQDHFRIIYVDGFFSDGFAYFVTIQRKSLDRSAPYVTKLVRVCANDTKYQTYAELPLDCRGSDNDMYNLAQAVHLHEGGSQLRDALPSELKGSVRNSMKYLSVAFSKGTDPHKPGTNAGLCVYSMVDIRSMFMVNIERCNGDNANLHKNLPHFGFNTPCSRQYDSIPTDSCVPARVGGELALTKAVLLEYTSLRLTALTGHVVRDEIVVLFGGTSDGRVKKIALESLRHSAREFGEVTLQPGSAIAQDIILERDDLFAASASKIFKLPAQQCSQHSTCSSCLQSGDPHCGWCTLENRCAPLEHCRDGHLAERWQAQGAKGRCLAADSIHPANASIHASAEQYITLTFNYLPFTQSPVKCAFDDVMADADVVAPNAIRCRLPPVQERPTLKKGQDHITIPLQIWNGLIGSVFYEDEFVFYDCSAQRLCTSCLQSVWPCNWCLRDALCVDATQSCSDEAQVIASAVHAVNSPSSMLTPESRCPHIDQSTQIRIPSGFPSKIEFRTVNLDKVVASSTTDLACVLFIETAEVTQPATLGEGGHVTCGEFPYSYYEAIPHLEATLQLVLGTDLVIDRINVDMYKCEHLSEDCSQCLVLDPSYSCAYCGGGCRFSKACPPTLHDATCPAPVITAVRPLSGPIEGGTRVVIEGHELGSSLDEVDGRVFIAESPCTIVDYEVSKKITCTTTQNVRGYSGVAKVIVRSTAQTAVSEQEFQYVDPSIYSFSPQFGPRSGGTLLTVRGAHLNSATRLKASLGPLPCIVEGLATPSEFRCRTTAAPSANYTASFITVQFDTNANRTLRLPFRYRPDPLITRIDPLSTFESGGRSILIHGDHLNAVQQPQIFLLDGEFKSQSERCLVSDDGHQMECRYPAIDSLARSRRRHSDGPTSASLTQRSEVYEVGVGFEMDGVQMNRQYKVTVSPDPVFRPFVDFMKIHRGEALVIEGERLTLAADSSDVLVSVGEEPCNITLLSSTQLVCIPPERKPRALESNGQPYVTVAVGNLDFPLGELVYDWTEPMLSLGVIGAVVAAASSMMLILIGVFAFWWRKKSSQAEKDYKRIQLRMDTLESSVRTECKQAFAELQTDMTDLTSDLVALGIPYHSRRVYASKFMFKDDHTLSVDWNCSTTNGYTNHFGQALGAFEALLWNRQFVLTMVDCLEQQQGFVAPDRVYLASLLTATLARNMHFFTDIVLTLLKILIAKSVEGRHPQLMLRRTESCVEKMLANWIALCQYDSLQESAGSSLFLMFKALKHQVEKGPVDAMTGDARYSLSEDRLLKEQINPKAILIYIIPPNTCHPDEKLTCRVLDCDTISQAKAKLLDTIYRNMPFSSRPTVQDVDLEWRAINGPITLHDDETLTSLHHSPRSDTGTRQLNTLSHYGVPATAVMALVPLGQMKSQTYSTCSNHTYASIGTNALLLPSRSPDSSMSLPSMRYFHLRQPDEGSVFSITTGRSSPTRSIPEIYLTRLLTTKCTVARFIDDFFVSALSTDRRVFPAPLKYLFDLFEQQARLYNVEDAQCVVRAWKNNSLPLRFWVNVIKNPEFVFDVDKTPTVDACLSVIAQAFMDACSTNDVKLGKDSPSNKLLFAKELPQYRSLVTHFYSSVQSLPTVSDQELNQHMTKLSQAYAQEFNVTGALRELLGYVIKFREPLLHRLSHDSSTQPLRLAEKLNSVLAMLSQNSPHFPHHLNGTLSSKHYDESV